MCGCRRCNDGGSGRRLIQRFSDDGVALQDNSSASGSRYELGGEPSVAMMQTADLSFRGALALFPFDFQRQLVPPA